MCRFSRARTGSLAYREKTGGFVLKALATTSTCSLMCWKSVGPEPPSQMQVPELEAGMNADTALARVTSGYPSWRVNVTKSATCNLLKPRVSLR